MIVIYCNLLNKIKIHESIVRKRDRRQRDREGGREGEREPLFAEEGELIKKEWRS